VSRPTIIGIVGPSALLLGLTPLSAQAPGGNRASGTTAAATPAAATPAATSIIVQRVPEPPRLDDFLGERPAPGAAVTSDFRQREPGDGVPVSAPTTAYLSYDDANLYVVFVCQDDPAKIRAGLTRREEITVDDGVALYLDTFHDRKRAYLFQANPNGVQLDGIVTEGQDDDYSFDAVWDSDGRLTPNGYVVRIAIPFRSLRFPSTPTQTWGIALVRYIRRTNEEASWPLVTKRLAGFVPQFGTLEVHWCPLPRHRTAGVPTGERPPRRDRRQGRRQGCAHTGRHRQPGLQPGGIGRAASDDQRAVRSLLPREAPLFH